MMKLTILSGLILSASCMVLRQPQIPLSYGLEYHDTPNYNFAYEVNDAHTGDIKSQHETRRGESVLGQYTLLQPDGVRRTVDYRADEHAGFRATVNNEGRPIQHQINQDQINQYQSNQPQVNQYQANQPQVNQYQVNQPQLNQYPANQPQVNQYQSYQPQLNQQQVNQYQSSQQQQVQLNAEQRSNLGQSNLAGYWPAPTLVSTPAPAVAISRSSIVQTFSHGNQNPWL